jgi:hypothetical protein
VGFFVMVFKLSVLTLYARIHSICFYSTHTIDSYTLLRVLFVHWLKVKRNVYKWARMNLMECLYLV